VSFVTSRAGKEGENESEKKRDGWRRNKEEIKGHKA
jgi:hypothetical protein